MMVPFSQLYQDVRNSVPGCPTALVQDALRRAAIDLCTYAWVHQAALDPIALQANEAAYDLITDPGTQVIGVSAASVGGQRLQLVTLPQLPANLYDWETRTGSPCFALPLLDQEQLRLVPLPERDYPEPLRVTVVLAPSDEALGIERDLYLRYQDVIAAGARAALLLLPNKPWTNPQLAQIHDSQFTVGKSRARQHLLTGNAGVALGVRAPRFSI